MRTLFAVAALAISLTLGACADPTAPVVESLKPAIVQTSASPAVVTVDNGNDRYGDWPISWTSSCGLALPPGVYQMHFAYQLKLVDGVGVFKERRNGHGWFKDSEGNIVANLIEVGDVNVETGPNGILNVHVRYMIITRGSATNEFVDLHIVIEGVRDILFSWEATCRG